MKYLLGIFFICFGLVSFSQEDKSFKGQISGQWRTYYLSTYNDGDLKDFYALATGGKIKYVQSLGKNFKLGGALYTSINLGVQDLTMADQITGKVSRYEAGLFDVEDLGDRFIGFPGELFIQFTSPKHELTIGRMKIISPFINSQDGRMIPTLEQGIWYSFQPEKIKIQFGLFNQIAPRSTSRFMGIGESIGKYPVGRNPDGSVSHYDGNTKSDYVALLNVNFNPFKNLEIEVWEYYIDNVFHSTYLKPTMKINEKTAISAEWLHQDKISNGGNAIDSLRYFADRSSNVLGLQFSQKIGDGKLMVSYNHILKGGRFIFPREWGREMLFSFQKRERSEGSANSHALVAYYDRNFGDNEWRGIFSIGHHWKPDVTNPDDNKYAIPNYYHANLDLFWMPEKLKGLRPELLMTYKIGSGDFPENPNFILNKVDMFQVNFIVNFNF
ncbi:MAG: OprD family outer membrane porin [Bacteroidota bacterium]